MLKMRFQWFFDISTAADTMQIITVSAGGETVVKRLAPFFTAFKYYKLGAIKATFVPASTLPIDPTGLSYEAGENTVDPRDQLNPGLTRITNGEDTFENLTGLSADTMRKMYNTMMLDTRWYKWQLQSGLKRSAYPMYWQIGQLHQDSFPGAIVNVPDVGSTLNYEIDTVARMATTVKEDYTVGVNRVRGFSDPRGLFQTGHRGRLGWMPTDALAKYATTNGVDGYREQAIKAPVPEIEVFKVILPPAYKTKYYYRVYVTEEVYFAAPLTNFAEDYRSIDRFLTPVMAVPDLPSVAHPPVQSRPIPPNDGGGS